MVVRSGAGVEGHAESRDQGSDPHDDSRLPPSQASADHTRSKGPDGLVRLHAFQHRSKNVPVPEAHSKPEQAKVVPLPVDSMRRRGLEILVGPGVTCMGISFSMNIL